MIVKIIAASVLKLMLLHHESFLNAIAKLFALHLGLPDEY
jgi:hypothetical protein